MSDETNTQSGAGTAPAAAPTDTSERPQEAPGFELSDFAPTKPVTILLAPQSNKPGQARVTLTRPERMTITNFERLLFGFNGKKANQEAATDSIIRKHFVSLEGINMPPEWLSKYAGDWKRALLAESRARPIANAIANAYINKVRLRAEDEEDEDA